MLSLVNKVEVSKNVGLRHRRRRSVLVYNPYRDWKKRAHRRLDKGASQRLTVCVTDDDGDSE